MRVKLSVGREYFCTHGFNKPTHAGPCDPTPAKNLHRILCSLLRRACGIHLEERNLPRELVRLLLIVHIVHLERDVFQPALSTLDAGDHLRELGADDSL